MRRTACATRQDPARVVDDAWPRRAPAGNDVVTSRVRIVQGGYYVATGVLPFASRRAFEAATGPKREWWLVQTVGALVTVIGGALLVGASRQRATPELLGIAAGSAASLAAIDVIYVAKRRISPRYLADAAAEIVLLGLAVTAAADEPNRERPDVIHET